MCLLNRPRAPPYRLPLYFSREFTLDLRSSAFAHTPTSPTSSDSRCSALGCGPEAPHNGRAIGAGLAAAPIHRIHHSNEHPVSCANIGRVRIPVSAACTALGAYYLPPSGACSRHKLLAAGC
jgi:hypothetical protein